jgi:hypothetical protein
LSFVHSSAQACIFPREAGGNLGGGAEVSGGGGTGKGAFGGATWTRVASFFGSRGATWDGATWDGSAWDGVTWGGATWGGLRSAGAGAFSFFFASSRGFAGTVFPAVGFAFVFSASAIPQ